MNSYKGHQKVTSVTNAVKTFNNEGFIAAYKSIHSMVVVKAIHCPVLILACSRNSVNSYWSMGQPEHKLSPYAVDKDFMLDGTYNSNWYFRNYFVRISGLNRNGSYCWSIINIYQQ